MLTNVSTQCAVITVCQGLMHDTTLKLCHAAAACCPRYGCMLCCPCCYQSWGLCHAQVRHAMLDPAVMQGPHSQHCTTILLLMPFCSYPGIESSNSDKKCMTPVMAYVLFCWSQVDHQVWVQEAELEKAKGLLSRFKNDHMTKLLDLLDIPRSELKDKVRPLCTCSRCCCNLLPLVPSLLHAIHTSPSQVCHDTQ